MLLITFLPRNGSDQIVDHSGWLGEWLRREKRRAEARDQLRSAFDALTSMGAEAFAERARLDISSRLELDQALRKREARSPADL